MSPPIKLSSRPTQQFWELVPLFEDAQCLALNKPGDLLTSPDPAQPDRPSLLGLLQAGLQTGAPWATSRQLEFLAPTHPLDAEATGVVLLAKTPEVAKALARQFAEERTRQHCIALAQGAPAQDAFIVEARLAPDAARPGCIRVAPHHGRRAITRFTVLERFRHHALLACEPQTQHDHQIRVHLQSLRLPVSGDPLYGGQPLWLSQLKPGYRYKEDRDERPLLPGTALHAESLTCRQPATGEELTLKAPWPKPFHVALKYLRRYAPALASLALGLHLHLPAAEPEVDLTELPRFAPVEATNALATFTVKSGFRLELVAAEPLVRDPIEICFDADGRMFVVEMIDYSERRQEQPHAGRIRRLEDTDGDGRFDRSLVFVDDLPWPTGVFCWQDGVFVTATPDLLFCRDADGDGRAEIRQRVFTGFGIDFAPFEVTRLNMQAMVNSLRWGLDNRVYGLTGPNGGELTSPLWPSQPPVNVRGRDFAFDPRTFALEAIAGGGQYGMSFNDRGQRFTCNNSDHLRLFHYEARDAARNPALALPPSLQSIAADGPAATVFRHSPDEPWRVIRTRWRVAGLVPGPIEGGGRASGYFTSATGLMAYRGDAWPAEFLGDVFIADCGSNLIHRKQVRRQGFGFVGQRPPDETQTEFLASTDTWFRPVQLANAPDGTLYLVDMYREIIEHPWSLPPSLKQHLDLNAGNDRGRIYRILPDGFQPRPPPQLSTAPTRELVATLAHPNAWHRETAARLLYERQDHPETRPALETLVRESPAPLGRLHGLYALLGQDALRPEHLLHAFQHDPDERVREHAVRLASPFLLDPHNPATRDRLGASLAALVEDPAPAVRYQLAFTLGDWPNPRRLDALAALARRDGQDPWMRAALLTSLSEGAADLFDRLGHAPSESAAGPDMLHDLARIIGAQHRTPDLDRVIGRVVQTSDPALALSLTHALAEGLQRARVPLPRERLAAVFARAAEITANPAAADAVRRQAITLLGQTTFAESGPLLLALLVPSEPPPLQLAALAALGRFADDALGPELIARWRSFSPRVRDEALTVLLARPERALVLLAALEREVVHRAHLNATQVQFLTGHRDPQVRAQAAQILTSATTTERDTVVQTFLPALDLTGDPARGMPLFTERCASCHRLGGEGYAVGPDIVSVRNAGKEKLLISLLDPSRELLPQYVAYEIETRDEESLLGFVVEETATHLTLRQAYGQDTVLPRSAITHLSSGGRSIMPDELEAGLSHQDLADLLEYLLTASP